MFQGEFDHVDEEGKIVTHVFPYIGTDAVAATKAVIEEAVRFEKEGSSPSRTLNHRVREYVFSNEWPVRMSVKDVAE